MIVVEDDPATYKALRVIFTHRGWDVSVAVTLAEARPMIEAGEADCVILDLMLPDGNGVDLLKLIRERDLSIRVVVTTGANEPELLDRVGLLRPEGLLRKPILLEDLVHAIGGSVQ